MDFGTSGLTDVVALQFLQASINTKNMIIKRLQKHVDNLQYIINYSRLKCFECLDCIHCSKHIKPNEDGEKSASVQNQGAVEHMCSEDFASFSYIDDASLNVSETFYEKNIGGNKVFDTDARHENYEAVCSVGILRPPETPAESSHNLPDHCDQVLTENEPPVIEAGVSDRVDDEKGHQIHHIEEVESAEGRPDIFTSGETAEPREERPSMQCQSDICELSPVTGLCSCNPSNTPVKIEEDHTSVRNENSCTFVKEPSSLAEFFPATSQTKELQSMESATDATNSSNSPLKRVIQTRRATNKERKQVLGTTEREQNTDPNDETPY